MVNINVGRLIEPKSWQVLYEEHLWKPLDKLLTYYREQDTINSCYGEYFTQVLSELASDDESLEYITKHIPNIQGSPLRLHLHQDKYIKQTSLSWYEGGFSYHFRGNIYTTPVPITDALKEGMIVESYTLMVDDNDTFQLDIREDSKGERYYYTPEVSEHVQTSQELSLIYQFFDGIHQYIELMNDIGHYCDDYRYNAERIMLKHHHESIHRFSHESFTVYLDQHHLARLYFRRIVYGIHPLLGLSKVLVRCYSFIALRDITTFHYTQSEHPDTPIMGVSVMYVVYSFFIEILNIPMVVYYHHYLNNPNIGTLYELRCPRLQPSSL